MEGPGGGPTHICSRGGAPLETPVSFVLAGLGSDELIVLPMEGCDQNNRGRASLNCCVKQFVDFTEGLTKIC